MTDHEIPSSGPEVDSKGRLSSKEERQLEKVMAVLFDAHQQDGNVTTVQGRFINDALVIEEFRDNHGNVIGPKPKNQE